MQPFPKWVSWIFVCFLAYIIYIGNRADTPPASAPEEPIATAAQEAPKDYESLRQLTDGDRWLRAINPNHVGEANIKEITQGSGEAASCGSTVEVLLRGTGPDGENFDSTHDESKPLTFTLGDAPIKALNEGLIGMKQGGVRLLSAPANLVYADPAKRTINDVKFHLTLQRLERTATKDMPMMASTLVMGTDDEEPVRCGFPFSASITVFGADGKRLAKTNEPVSLTLGKAELARGVDVLARGMKLGETRLLTIPPDYLQQGDSTNTALRAVRDALKANELRIVYVERVSPAQKKAGR
jgi:FKBP-type peptidyl-prolyl cis-trans isomerase 2